MGFPLSGFMWTSCHQLMCTWECTDSRLWIWSPQSFLKIVLSLLKPTLSKVCGDCFAEIVKAHRFSWSLSQEDLVDKSLLGQWEWSWWKCRWVVSVGNKLNNLDVVYTPWYNLRKTQSMDVGQVGFHNPKLVRTLDLVVVAPFWSTLRKRRPVAFALG